MSDYYWEWKDETLNKRAVIELIWRHRDEYEALAEAESAKKIEELERLIRRYQDDIAKLKALNPQGVNAGALVETANILASENDRLAAQLRARGKK